MNKKCSKCLKEKPFDVFHRNYKNKDGLHYHCKACRKEESLKKYGLTLSEYDDILESQGGLCAICKTDDPRGHSKAGRFHVDHNHTSGAVRGLLCHDCNTGLGFFKDSTALLEKAKDYLNNRGSYADES